MKNETQYLKLPFSAAGNAFFDPLTPPQRQVAGQIICGESNKDIAAKGGISPNTVKSHVKAIFRKLNVSRREDLLAQYFGPADPEQVNAVALHYGLSPQQKKVLEHVLFGETTQETANALSAPEATIRSHLYGLFNKLGISSKDEAFVLVHGYGVLGNQPAREPAPEAAL